MLEHNYQIVVAGQFDPPADEGFAGFDVRPTSGGAVITGTLDQAALFGLIDRIRYFQLDLVEMRRFG